ncbi:MAG: hypothetical protein ABI970_23035, partial [Chloroflexota bacterium]
SITSENANNDSRTPTPTLPRKRWREQAKVLEQAQRLQRYGEISKANPRYKEDHQTYFKIKQEQMGYIFVTL